MTKLTDLYGPQDAFLDDLAASVADPQAPPIRDQFAADAALLGPARSGDFVSGIGQEPSAATVGSSPFDVATMVASGSITADSIAAGSITANKLAVGGIGGYNLVANPSFESGLTGWGVSGTPPVIEPAVGHHGAQSLKYTAGGYKYAVQTLPVFKALTTYTASVWVLGSSATSSAGAGIVIENLGTLGSGSVEALVIGTLPGDWTRLSTTFTLGAADKSTGAVVVTNSYGGTSTGTIRIDAVQVEEGGILTAFGLGGTDLRNSTAEVVIDSSGITVTNGKIAVQNPGSTVIIDGTSDMFRISATGTTSVAAAVGPGVRTTTTVSLSALGTVTTTPAHLSFMSNDNSSAGAQYIGSYRSNETTFWVANTSGGATTTSVVSALLVVWMDVTIVASTVTVRLAVDNATAAPITFYGRYYILAQAAI